MNALTPIMDFRPAYWQLSPMERQFCDGYVKDIETIADKTGQRLLAVLQSPFPYELDQRAIAMLALPMVRAAVAERIRELSEIYDISIYRTIKELGAVAYSNIQNYVKLNEFGEPEVDLRHCTPEQWSAIKAFEIEDKPRGGRKIKFILHDKMSALPVMMRYQGLLADDNPHWRKQEQSVAPVGAAVVPVGATDDSAADLYARSING